MLRIITSLSFLYALTIVLLILYGWVYYRDFTRSAMQRKKFPLVFLVIGAACFSFLWINIHAPLRLKTFSNLDHHFIRHDGFLVNKSIELGRTDTVNFDNNPFSHASPFARIMEQGRVQSLTQVGIRTLNTHQQAQAKKFGVTFIEMKDFNYEFIEKLASPLYISLDLDVLDPAFAPGVSHHEPGGLSARELLTIIQKIKVPVTGADIVEYNPIRDINNMTAMVAYKLMKELISIMSD